MQTFIREKILNTDKPKGGHCNSNSITIVTILEKWNNLPELHSIYVNVYI